MIGRDRISGLFDRDFLPGEAQGLTYSELGEKLSKITQRHRRDRHTSIKTSDNREREVPYDTISMWNIKKKKDTNVLIHQTETDFENKLNGYQRRKAGGEIN